MNPYSQLRSMKGDAESSGNRDGSRICMSSAPTSGTSTQPPGKAEWIALRRDSLARIFHARVRATESAGSNPDLYGNCSGQLTLFGHRSFSLKTRRTSEPRDGVRSSGPSWREDIPGETEPLRPLMSARGTEGIDGGASPPTPPACGSWNGKGASRNGGVGSVETRLRMPTLCKAHYKGAAKRITERSRWHLPTVLYHLPTLTKADGTGGPGRSRNRRGGLNLRTALSELLNSADFPDATRNQLQLREPIPERSVGHRLTSAFAEWWMGWPIGWTALKPAETGKSRSKRR